MISVCFIINDFLTLRGCSEESCDSWRDDWHKPEHLLGMINSCETCGCVSSFRKLFKAFCIHWIHRIYTELFTATDSRWRKCLYIFVLISDKRFQQFHLKHCTCHSPDSPLTPATQALLSSCTEDHITPAFNAKPVCFSLILLHLMACLSYLS